MTRAGDGQPLGIVSYLSIVPEHGVIEIGNIWFGPELQRTPAATEAIFLLAKHAFDDLGYRRLEWKCNALNEPSRRAATRFGFEFEGVFTTIAWSRDATATVPGSRSQTPAGPRSAPDSKPG